MRTKDNDILLGIKQYVNEYCNEKGRGPSVGDVARKWDISKSTAQAYLIDLKAHGEITQSEFGYESLALSETRSAQSVPILGAVPCGPLTEVEEYIEGYVRLPESFVGKGKFYFLKATGNSMIDAGIHDGDLVLVRQQETANYNDIVVALVDNEVTLKRYRPDLANRRIILHPENKRMKDIVVEECKIQGVATKVIKNLES